MAKTSMIIKQQRQAKKQNFPTRKYSRCVRCGRVRGVVGKFKLCRLCMRELAHNGMLPGVKKSSW